MTIEEAIEEIKSWDEHLENNPKKKMAYNIPYLMHKEMNVPLLEHKEAYDVVIDYLRNKGKDVVL